MKKIPKKKRKVTELYFNEYDGTAEIYAYNTKLKRRLTAYPSLCRMLADDEHGGLRFEIDKYKISIRPAAPYSEKCKIVVRHFAKSQLVLWGVFGKWCQFKWYIVRQTISRNLAECSLFV